MNSNDLQGLFEAYLQVESLDESVEQLNELSDRKLRAYIKKSDKSHKEINKKWDQGIATEKEKLKSIGHEEGQRRAYKKLDAKEDFENWINDLVEEGYDLSEYTWEEMFDIYEAEGSYGKTPKARQAMGKLAISRREKPASDYSQKGEKTKKVKEIEKHTRRIDNGPDVGNRGKRSTPSSRMYSGKRGKLDQDSRDYARDSAVEYTTGGHKPGSGTVTKNPKKLRKQKAMGEIDESLNAYEIVLSHLIEEGYASTEHAADKIILNMSESWFEEIMEARRSEKEGMGSPEQRTASGHLVGQRGEKKRKGEMGGRHFWSGGQGGSNMERGKKKVKGAKEDENKSTQHGRNSVFQGRTEKSGKYSEMQAKKRGSEMGSRFD